MDLLLPTTTVQLPIFNRIAIIVINFSVISLLLTVFNHNRFKDIQSKIFLGMGVLMLLWVDFAYLARLVGKYDFALSELYLRIAWVATPLLFFFTYLTSIYVIKKEENFKFISTGLLFMAFGLSSLTAFSDLIIRGVEFMGNDLDIVYGAGFYPFLFVISLFMVATLFPLLRKKLNRASKSFLVGVLIFYLANMLFNILLPVFLEVTRYYYIGDYSTIFLLGLTAYSIVRHELFDIRIVATEAITILIWIILFAKLFVTQSTSEVIIDSIILALVVVFGIMLIRSVITEVKNKERLQKLTDRLREIDKQKDEFISVAAHELRSPLTAIKGYLSMVIEGDGGKIPDTARSYLSDASAVNDRLVRLVNNMLNVSRIEEGRLVYQMEDTELVKVVEEVYFSFKFEAKRKKLDFKMDVADGIDDTVRVDPDRVREVIGNLVSNAVKFTEEGSVTIKLYNPKKDTIRCDVIDTGPGITKPEQKKLFQKFFRASSTEGKTMGTGLGLYITKLLVERFGGKIGLESEFGRGSTFWFSLPLVTEKVKR
jgi:signal transduction histidine kinase